MTPPLLSIRGLRTYFYTESGVAKAVDGVDLDVRQGEVLGLDAGFSTLEQACAEMNGADWREMIEQRAVEVAMFKRKGLKLPQWGAAEEPASHTETRPQPV